jgi:hypothetical protein
MKVLFTLLLFSSFIGCSDASLEYNKVQGRLISSMQTYLYKEINNDSSKVKYHVQEVRFFEDKEFYECEFKVHMQTKSLDTTGFMTARISKDFNTVKRKS